MYTVHRSYNVDTLLLEAWNPSSSALWPCQQLRLPTNEEKAQHCRQRTDSRQNNIHVAIADLLLQLSGQLRPSRQTEIEKHIVQTIQLSVRPALAEELRVGFVVSVHHRAGFDNRRRACPRDADADGREQAAVEDDLVRAACVWETEEDKEGDEESVGEDGGGFCAEAVDGPAEDGAADEVEEAEGKVEEPCSEGVEVEQFDGDGGDGGVEAAEQGSLDEGYEEGNEETGIFEAREDGDGADDSGLVFGELEFRVVIFDAAEEWGLFVCGCLAVLLFSVLVVSVLILVLVPSLVKSVFLSNSLLDDEDTHAEVYGEHTERQTQNADVASLLIQQPP